MSEQASACDHPEFAASVDVGRLTDVVGGPVTHFTADVTIICVRCRMSFVFIGLPPGVGTRQPCVSIDGSEARLPITPMEGALAYAPIAGRA